MIGNRFTAWFLYSFLYFYQYIFRVLPNIIAPDLCNKFGVGVDMIGQFAGIYYIGYTIAHIPAGLAFDHMRPNVVFSIACCMVALGILPLTYSDSWFISEIGRFTVGLGSAIFVIGSFKLTEVNYGIKRFGRMSGFTLAIGLAGAVYGGAPVQKLIRDFGWDITFNISVISWFALGILCCFALPNKANHVPKEKGTEESILHSLISVLFNKRVLSIGFFGGLMVGPLEGFADAWSRVFLESIHHISEAHANFASSMIFIGMGLGTAISPIIFEKGLFDTTGMVILCGTMMLSAITMMMFIPMSYPVLIGMFLLLGFGCSYQVMLSIDVVREMPARAALAGAIMNMCVMVFGYVFHYIMTAVLQRLAGNKLESFYPPEIMVKSIAVIPIAMVLGICGFIYLNRRDAKARADKV